MNQQTNDVVLTNHEYDYRVRIFRNELRFFTLMSSRMEYTKHALHLELLFGAVYDAKRKQNLDKIKKLQKGAQAKHDIVDFLSHFTSLCQPNNNKNRQRKELT